MEENTSAESAEHVQTFYFAGIGQRFVAGLIDGIIIGIVSSVISFSVMRSSESSAGNLINLVLSLGYIIYFLSQSGQTIGKKAMNIKVVNEDGTQISVQTAVVRTISTYLSAAVIFLGYIWAFFNPKKQTWHDLIAKTYVIKTDK